MAEIEACSSELSNNADRDNAAARQKQAGDKAAMLMNRIAAAKVGARCDSESSPNFQAPLCERK